MGNFDLNVINSINNSEDVPDFKCQHCGVHIEDWICEDPENPDESIPFSFAYCPNCGIPVNMPTEVN